MATREVKKYVTGKVDFSIDSLVGGTCSKTSASKDPFPSASSTPSPVEKFATDTRSGGGGGSAFSQPTGNGNSSTAAAAAAAALWNQQSANQLTDYISLMAAQHMGLLKAGGNGGVFLPQHPAAAGLLSSNGGSGGAGSHANGNPFVGNFSTDLNKQQAGGANGLWQLPTYLQEALQKSVVLAGPPYSRFFSGQDIGHHGYHPYRKPKRIRTAFNPHQLLRLEQSFDRNHYVVGTERKDLAKSLCLSETQVKVWFQNRRTKFKRQKNEDDSKKSSNDSSNNKNSSAGRSKGDKPSMTSSGAAGDKEVTSSSSSGRGSHGAGLMALQDGSRSINVEDDDDDVMDDEEEDEEDQILLEDDDESSGNASN